MGRKPTGRPSQRPEAEIDWNKVDMMILAGCSGSEIAGAMPKPIHPDTFYRRFEKEYGMGFSEYSPERKEGGKGNVRLKQYISALQGNTQMLKTLGEEWLGQGKRDNSTEGDEARIVIYLTEKIEKLEAALLSRGVSLSDIQVESPVPHQGCAGEEDQVRNELGTENPMGGEA